MKANHRILTFANVIERVVYVNYKRGVANLIAKYILRLARFNESTSPLVPFMLIIGAIIGGMVTAFDSCQHVYPSKFAILLGTIEYSLIFLVITYLIWEMYRGWLLLENWAKTHNK